MSTEGNQSAASSEVHRNLSSPLPDNEVKGTHLKFLLSNAEAGSIIGKGGSTINDIQSQSGARIQLSRNYEYFPGTSDRIIMVSGGVDDKLKAVDLILSKLLDEFNVEDGGEVNQQSRIRSLIEDSGAGIKISPQDNYYPGVHDRLVTVTGSLREQLRAVELILLKFVEDPYYQQSANAPFPYAAPAAAYNGMNYGPNVVGMKYQDNRSPNKEESSSVTIGIADEHIGLVVGRGGRSITEISQHSGTRIKISDRGDFMSGTSDRKVTITGPQRAIRVAESMISSKVASVTER